MVINKLEISDNLGQKSVERLNKCIVFLFHFGFCPNSVSPRSPHSMLLSRSLLHLKFFVFATVSLPQFSLNINLEWGEGGRRFKCEKMVIVPQVLAKIVASASTFACFQITWL